MVTVGILYPFKVKKKKRENPNPYTPVTPPPPKKNQETQKIPQDLCLMFVHTHIDTFLTVSEILLNKVLLIKKNYKNIQFHKSTSSPPPPIEKCIDPRLSPLYLKLLFIMQVSLF